MAELQIDDDWKKQAQEEKRRLAEQAAAEKAQHAPASAQTDEPRPRREIPTASFETLVSTIVTQALYYLGEMGQEAEQTADLDMAKLQIDTLGVLEEKTKGNITADEQAALDSALYELRMRFVSVATQLIR
ncbi:MAG TPA: DUF1844 domain-containing protein [Tepidisphaeraceae bacterium]|nr:DUF1844 domain-containing protein [Tepidisphaeraceae bacterium]